MDEIKLCKDCDWCDSNYEHLKEWICLKSYPTVVNPLNGVVGLDSVGSPCFSLRALLLDCEDDRHLCNKEARHFKPKAKEPDTPVKSCPTCYHEEHCCKPPDNYRMCAPADLRNWQPKIPEKVVDKPTKER